MQIRKLVIFGFGKHENKSIELTEGINIFYGLNEAGKTTIQQFILHILFGFPQKNQQQLRYEPKGGGKYGGQIHLHHNEYGDCIIERVKGKSSGDVTVYFEDGTRESEEALTKILAGYNRQGFEAIFSFSIHQLQGMEKMSEEDLSRTLLASGTTGVDRLTKLEKQLEKEMGELYKKTGKIPLINVKIEELRALEQSLKEHKEKIDLYEPSVQELNEISETIGKLQKEEQQLQEEWQQLTLYRQARPLLERKRALQNELANHTRNSFPSDGKRRYEQLKDKMQLLEGTIAQEKEALLKYQEQFRDFNEDEAILALDELLAKESEWHAWLSAVQKLADDLEQLEIEQQNYFRLLGIADKEQQHAIQHARVSLQQEQQFQTLYSQLEQLTEQKIYQERTNGKLQEEYVTLEQKYQQLQQQAPTAKEREDVANWPTKVEKAIEAKEALKANQGVTHNPTPAIIMSGILLLISIYFGVVEKNWPVLVLGVIMAIAIFALFGRKKQSSTLTASQVETYKQILREVDEKRPLMEQLSETIRKHEEKERSIVEQLEDKRRQQAQMQHTYDVTQASYEEIQGQLQQFLKQYYIQDSLHMKQYPELFRTLRDIQENCVTQTGKEKLKSATEKNIQERVHQASAICGIPCTRETTYATIRNAHSNLKEQKKEQVDLQSKIQTLHHSLTEKERTYSVYQQDVNSLFQEAEVEDEESYYQASEQFMTYQSNQEALKTIDHQLQSIGAEIEQFSLNEESLQGQTDSINNRLLVLRDEKDRLLKEQARLQHEMNELLSDEAYGNKLQQFELKKAELATLVKKWSTKKAIATAISETMHNLKEKKLPTVLEGAKQYFTFLTGGRYESLELNSDGIFEAVSIDGTRFSVAELSQATKEQAYISLRFALADSLLTSAPFPIIMDDPFVHFDVVRLQSMVQLMLDMEQQHQMLYFTCHENVLKEWPNANIIDVSAISDERSVSFL